MHSKQAGYYLCCCEFIDWLLQHCSCWCTSNNDEQATTCRHRHTEVWLQLQSDTPQWTSLARHPWPGVLQAGGDSSSVSERPCTCTVPVGLLCPDRQWWHRRHLRSANHQLLAVPHFKLNSYGRRAFSAARPTIWNSLQDFICDPTISADCFRRLLKTYLFAWYCIQRVTGHWRQVVYKSTYLFTYHSEWENTSIKRGA